MEKNSISLQITISEPNIDDEKMYELNTLLVNKIQESNLDVTIDEMKETLRPENVKGDPFTVGALILVTLPTLLPQLLGFLQGWLVDRRKISIEAPNGTKVEFTPNKKLSEKEIIDLAKKLNRIQAAKSRKK